MQKVNWFGWNSVFGGCWDRWLRIRIQNSEIQYGGPKCKKLLDLDEILYSGVIEVADYESEFKIPKFKMANPIWRTKMQKVTWSRWNSILGGIEVAWGL